jgi:1,4-alpha-glucan branching enzyme
MKTLLAFEGSGLKTVQSSPKSNEAPESACENGNSRAPVQPISKRFPTLEEEELTLTLLAPQARQVQVVGNFNSWCPEATPMKDTGAGEWVVRLMLRSGQYEYLFVVDGRWMEDPQAVQRAANLHGGYNSVLLVPLAVRTSIL